MYTKKKGFTLIEMMVAVALFAVVMTVSTGALLALIDATQKAQALQSVMSNLNTALDGMVRALRMGNSYYCNGVVLGVNDCPDGGIRLTFTPFEGDPNDISERWVYSYDASTKRLYKSENGGSTYFALTAPEVQIDNFSFYVVGTDPGPSDIVQPKVVMVVEGTAGAAKLKTRTTFSIQATAVQRLLDI